MHHRSDPHPTQKYRAGALDLSVGMDVQELMVQALSLFFFFCDTTLKCPVLILKSIKDPGKAGNATTLFFVYSILSYALKYM